MLQNRLRRHNTLMKQASADGQWDIMSCVSSDSMSPGGGAAGLSTTEPAMCTATRSFDSSPRVAGSAGPRQASTAAAAAPASRSLLGTGAGGCACGSADRCLCDGHGSKEATRERPHSPSSVGGRGRFARLVSPTFGQDRLGLPCALPSSPAGRAASRGAASPAPPRPSPAAPDADPQPPCVPPTVGRVASASPRRRQLYRDQQQPPPTEVAAEQSPKAPPPLLSQKEQPPRSQQEQQQQQQRQQHQQPQQQRRQQQQQEQPEQQQQRQPQPPKAQPHPPLQGNISEELNLGAEALDSRFASAESRAAHGLPEEFFSVADGLGWRVCWPRGGEWLVGRRGAVFHERLVATWPAGAVPGALVGDEERSRVTVVIACPRGKEHDSERLVRALRQASRFLDAFVVMCESINAGAVQERERALQLQAAMLRAGAVDVICNAGSADELRLLIELSARRRRTIETGADGARGELEKLRGEVEALVKQGCAQGREEERSKALIWQVVDCLLEGFPKQDFEIEADPGPGTCVGPCRLYSELGRGSFARVFLAKNMETKASEAVKVIAKSTIGKCSELTTLWKEVTHLSRLKHKHIAPLIGVLHGPRHIFLRMQFAGESSLYGVMKVNADAPLGMKKAKDFEAQLASAIGYCHEQGVAHRDLKPENIAVSTSVKGQRIKVVDFGQSVKAAGGRIDVAGSFPFMAPEAVVWRPAADLQGEPLRVFCACVPLVGTEPSGVLACSVERPYAPAAVDIWGCGMVLLEMVCGSRYIFRLMGWTTNTPVTAERADELIACFSGDEAILRALRSSDALSDYNLVELLRGLLEVDPRSRLTAGRMCASAWLSKLERQEPQSASRMGTLLSEPQPASRTATLLSDAGSPE